MYAGQFLSCVLSISQRSRKRTASWSTRVNSFKSKVMRRPFGSELSNVFNSRRFSASIRPLTVKTTSPFPALVILSIFPLKNSYFCCCSERQVICSCDGNHSSKQEVLKTYELAAGKMSETSAIAESSDSILFLPLHCGLSGRCLFFPSPPGFAFAKASVKVFGPRVLPSFPTSWQRSLLAAKLHRV